MRCACAFSPLKENQAKEPFRVYLNHTVAYDIHLHAYKDPFQTHFLDDTLFYFIWLTYGSRLMYPHLPERVMRQFGYVQFVLRDPSDSTPPTIAYRNVDVMYDNFLNHLVLADTRGKIALSD